MKIAFQGIKGAYSEAAIYKHFGKDVGAAGYETFEEVFEVLKDGKVDFALVPVENSIAGNVAVIYDLLLKEKVFVVAEVFLKIRHHLLSHKANRLGNIKVAYSHPHALAQCRGFLNKNKIKMVQKYDTAGAAKIVSERKNLEESAIASELCAERYGLRCLVKDISTNKNNFTRFFVIVKEENIPDSSRKEKTSIAFKTRHTPGALVNCLQIFSKNGVNLTKLESRPTPENPWEYVFYTDFEGGLEDKKVKTALKEMRSVSRFIKILGSYPKGNGF